MNGFVVEYNRRTREVRVTPFLGPEGHRAALKRRLQLEAERTDLEWEIASLASDSMETVRHTHSRYFEGERAAV